MSRPLVRGDHSQSFEPRLNGSNGTLVLLSDGGHPLACSELCGELLLFSRRPRKPDTVWQLGTPFSARFKLIECSDCRVQRSQYVGAKRDGVLGQLGPTIGVNALCEGVQNCAGSGGFHDDSCL